MPDGGVWTVLGLVAMVAGFVMILTFTQSDAWALGGAGLVVVGALCAAICFDDRTDA